MDEIFGDAKVVHAFQNPEAALTEHEYKVGASAEHDKVAGKV